MYEVCCSSDAVTPSAPTVKYGCLSHVLIGPWSLVSRTALNNTLRDSVWLP